MTNLDASWTETSGMVPRSLAPILLLTMLASIAVMYLCAVNGSVPTFFIASGLYALTAVIAGLRLNSPIWNPSPKREIRSAAQGIVYSTNLIASVYVWAGFSLLVVYPWSGLTWRHGWQYGGAMLLAATLLIIYAWHLNRTDSPLKTPKLLDGAIAGAALHVLGIGGALIYLIGSGKLETTKSDWAANHIFIAGGVALILLSIFEIRSHLILRKADTPSA